MKISKQNAIAVTAFKSVLELVESIEKSQKAELERLATTDDDLRIEAEATLCLAQFMAAALRSMIQQQICANKGEIVRMGYKYTPRA